ncbi:MAG: HPr family phosphocarrier protein [Vallitaleaceae bacterium]|jgi:phosphocarrier protein HPr|nr:HPr family phosphocarrier protein [Vallitaleaceae bacterium]
MLTKEAIIRNQVGLHARPAKQFAELAKRFASTILIKKGTKEVNAKSILMVLSLGAVCGDAVIITADGNDESAAIEALIRFAESDTE